MSKKIAFGWYGGKYSHLDFILPLLPKTRHFCEPFGGSAAVLINRKPSKVETYNDLDGEVVNFFKVLRDEPEALIEKLEHTPYARAELGRAIKAEPESEIEAARQFFVKARQTRTGLAQASTVGRWAYDVKGSRSGMAGVCSRWQGGIRGLEVVAERLKRVQIESLPALEIVEKYDSKGTLFYCDPPYVLDSRSSGKAYRHEMKDEEHQKLAELLHEVSGKAAISGYEGSLMDRLYEDWNRVSYSSTAHSNKSQRKEVVWANYPIKKTENGTFTYEKRTNFFNY